MSYIRCYKQYLSFNFFFLNLNFLFRFFSNLNCSKISTFHHFFKLVKSTPKISTQFSLFNFFIDYRFKIIPYVIIFSVCSSLMPQYNPSSFLPTVFFGYLHQSCNIQRINSFHKFRSCFLVFFFCFVK